jgi:hypothetical protein
LIPGFHDSVRIAFSGSQNAEEELNGIQVSFSRGYHDPAGIEFSGR